MAHSRVLCVDNRYHGAHGIGRYAEEVVARLTVPWSPLPLPGPPSPVRDFFRHEPRSPAHADHILYSPGFVVIPSIQKQVLTVHDLIHLQTNWPRRAAYLAYYNGPLRRQIRQAGVVMTVSQTSENAIREWLRDDAVQIVNAGNGCADIFTPEGPVASDGQPYILYVGNLRKHKNVDVLFRAAARSRHVRLVIVVPALDHDLASKRRHELNLDHMVDIIHQVSDNRLACLYRGAAALAMPSTLEGFGLPALESIQCGTPVIYWSGCQAVAEIVGNCGWALDTATDSDSWAGAMEKAVRQALTVEPSLGNYNWQHVALMVSEALATVVG